MNVTDFGIARAGASDMTRDRLDHGHRPVPVARAGAGSCGQRVLGPLRDRGDPPVRAGHRRGSRSRARARSTIALKQVVGGAACCRAVRPGGDAGARGGRAAGAGEGSGAAASADAEEFIAALEAVRATRRSPDARRSRTERRRCTASRRRSRPLTHLRAERGHARGRGAAAALPARTTRPPLAERARRAQGRRASRAAVEGRLLVALVAAGGDVVGVRAAVGPGGVRVRGRSVRRAVGRCRGARSNAGFKTSVDRSRAVRTAGRRSCSGKIPRSAGEKAERGRDGDGDRLQRVRAGDGAARRRTRARGRRCATLRKTGSSFDRVVRSPTRSRAERSA